MGTTLCAIAVVQVPAAEVERLAIVNVGDSRVYLLKDGQLEQVTDDHSLVASLERQGRLTREEAAVHPQRNIITRALGIDARVMVDSWEVVPIPGDRYVLCSDGLFNEVEENRIAATLRKLADPDDAASELVRLANEGGGRDNISVVIVDVLDDESAATDEAALAGDRVVAAVSGESRVAKGVALDLGEGPGVGADMTRAERRELKRSTRPPRPRRVTWRLLLFLAAVLGVIGIGAAAITYYGRHTYFVGFDADAVVIFRGRPGGVLWIEPEVVERTSHTRSDVPAGVVAEIERGKVEPTLDDAHRYLVNLDEQIGVTGSNTTLTTLPPTSTPTTPTTTGN
jgi:protein phosphatase